MYEIQRHIQYVYFFPSAHMRRIRCEKYPGESRERQQCTKKKNPKNKKKQAIGK